MKNAILLGIIAAVTVLPMTVQAQTETATRTTRATSAAAVDNTGWGGTLNVGVQASGGTQQQNVFTMFATAFHETGREPTSLHLNTRGRFDLDFRNAQKPDQPRITSTDVRYGEFRVAANAHQVLSAFRGSIVDRGSGDTRLWLYGIAGWYHHIAFDLDLQQAYGVGIAYDLPAMPGLAIAADLRHVKQGFATQAGLSSLALRIHQSYSYTWLVGPPDDQRAFVFAESVELIPVFESSDAFQSRVLIRLLLPLVRNMSVPIAFGSDYLRNASPGFKSHYWKTTVGLEFTFGPG